MKQVIPITILLFLTCGCGVKFFVIPNLASLITYKLGDYFELDMQDKESLNADIKKFLEKSKSSVAKIKERLISIDITKVRVKEEFEFLGHSYYELAQKLCPILAKEISKLEGGKKSDFYKNLDIGNDKIANRTKERKLEDYLKRFEFFFGDLTEKQISLLKNYLPTFKELSRLRLHSRLQIQGKLKKIHADNSLKDKKVAITHLLNVSSDRRQLDPTRSKLAQGIQEIVETLNKEQIQAFNERQTQFIDYINSYLETNYYSGR